MLWTMNKNSVFIQPLSFNFVHSFRLFLVVHSISIWLACNDCTLAAILCCSDQRILELCVGTHKWIYGKFNYLNCHLETKWMMLMPYYRLLLHSHQCSDGVSVVVFRLLNRLANETTISQALQFCVYHVSVWPIVRLYLHYCTLHYLCTVYYVSCVRTTH